jgi:dihydropteroate synthase
MFSLNCKGRLLVVDKPLVMGIINATPDSFYKGSRFRGTDAILMQAEKMIKDGADILDLGGQSTRPGSKKISETEELNRVIGGIEAIQKNIPEAILSIDTFYSRVAFDAVEAGASIINDISAGTMDEKMIATVASLKVPYVLMHMKGAPDTMQSTIEYQNMINEVLDFLIWNKAELNKKGIHDIIIYPGFGFGKTIAHNFD